jgi:hypothetical protein
MLVAVLLLAVLPAQTQTAAASDAPRDLVVSSYYWGRVENPDDVFSEDPQGGVLAERRKHRGYDPLAIHVTRRETYALVRNTGTRKIKTVTWDYIFYETAKHEHEIKRFEFRTKETIAPGEMKFLSEIVGEGPPSSYGVVVIQRIDYDDGTSWQRPASAETR